MSVWKNQQFCKSPISLSARLILVPGRLEWTTFLPGHSRRPCYAVGRRGFRLCIPIHSISRCALNPLLSLTVPAFLSRRIVGLTPWLPESQFLLLPWVLRMLQFCDKNTKHLTPTLVVIDIVKLLKELGFLNIFLFSVIPFSVFGQFFLLSQFSWTETWRMKMNHKD